MQGELGGRVEDQHVERAFVSRTPVVSAEVHHVRRVYDRQRQWLHNISHQLAIGRVADLEIP